MRKRTKIIIALTVSAFCVLVSAGAAYGAILSAEDHEEQIELDPDATPMDVEEGFSEAHISSLKEIEVGGHHINGNEIADAGSIGQSSAGDAASSDAVATGAEATGSNGNTTSSPTPAPRTLSILGNTIPYVDSYNTASAPMNAAGLWAGKDSTTDGSWAYFIGHHPGVFNCVMDLRNGDAVQVCDGNGNTRTYHVISIYDIPDETEWEQLAADVEAHGESITLQTCCGDHQHYRIVEAI